MTVPSMSLSETGHLSKVTAFTINKFDYVDFIYSDVKYRKDDIDALQETIRKVRHHDGKEAEAAEPTSQSDLPTTTLY